MLQLYISYLLTINTHSPRVVTLVYLSKVLPWSIYDLFIYYLYQCYLLGLAVDLLDPTPFKVSFHNIEVDV